MRVAWYQTRFSVSRSEFPIQVRRNQGTHLNNRIELSDERKTAHGNQRVRNIKMKPTTEHVEKVQKEENMMTMIMMFLVISTIALSGIRCFRPS